MKKYLSVFFLLLIASSLLYEVVTHREIFSTKYDAAYWEKRYEESGWAKGWEAENQIGDPELYAYAGWRQIMGDDPTEINPEVPPLGRYFLGLSILIFKNQYWTSLIFGLLLLQVTLLVGRMVIGNSPWALLPVLLLSWDKLFREDLSTSMLDLPFAFFIALSFYCLLKGRKNPRWYAGLAASLAAVAVTKMYLVGFALTGVIALYLICLFLVFRYRDIFWFIASLPAFLCVYFGSYLVYFLNGHNLFDFKYLHFWIRHFARVQVENYPKFEIWRILLLGQWKTWWGGSGVVSVGAWNPLWTLGTLSTIFTGFLSFKEKKLNLLILLIWIFSFLGMYAFGVPYPRYLLPILPAIYIILVISFKKIVEVKLWPNTKH